MSTPPASSRLSVRKIVFRHLIFASAMALLLVACAVFIYEERTHRPRELENLKDSSRLLFVALPSALDFNDAETASTYLRTYSQESNPRVLVAALYDVDGVLFARHARQGYEAFVPAARSPEGHFFDLNRLGLWQVVRREGAELGRLYILEELPPLSARLPLFFFLQGTVLFALAIVGILLIRGVRRRFIAPLSDLVATTGKVTATGDYSLRAAVPDTDEVARLACAFNAMLEEIGHRDAALQEATLRLRNLFDATTEVALISSDLQGLVTSFNVGAERMLGYSAKEVVGIATPQLWHKADEVAQHERDVAARVGVGKGANSLLTLAALGETDTRDWTFRRKDGREFPVQLSITVMRNAAGEPTGFLGVAVDISARRKAEAEREHLQSQLIQAQKIEAIGQLAGGVAHDFNNILAAMMLHIGLLKEDHQLPEDQRAALDEMEGYTIRASSLTRQLLVFSRRQVTQMRLVDLNSLVGNLLKMLHRLIGENISIEFKGTTGALWIVADSGMIEQVVMNLVVNARDAIGESGRVTLALGTLDVLSGDSRGNGAVQPGRYATLSVSDTGIGMDKETLARIFEPFFTTKAPGKGTGLGLATVQGIVEKHKGWVEVDSKPGQGTTFCVMFPRAPSEQIVDISSGRSHSIPRGTEGILLVEDDADVRGQVEAVLLRAGYTVWVARDGVAALAVWQDLKEDVSMLLSDMIMPGGMTGLELAQRVRRDKPAIRVIIMSGYSLELSQHGHAAEGMSYFAKPFLATDLARFVRQCLDAAPGSILPGRD